MTTWAQTHSKKIYKSYTKHVDIKIYANADSYMIICSQIQVSNYGLCNGFLRCKLVVSEDMEPDESDCGDAGDQTMVKLVCRCLLDKCSQDRCF